MAQPFKIGDEVSWNSRVGRVVGTVTNICTQDFTYRKRTRHASEQEPQYEVKSHKTSRIAFHKGTALSKLKQNKK